MIDKEIIELVAAKAVRKNIKKGGLLLRKGESLNSLFIVLEGCLRSYLVDKKGKEHTIQFAQEANAIGDYECFINGKTAILNIDALEDSVVLILNKIEKKPQTKAEIELVEIENKLYHHQLVTFQKRIIQLLSGTADERYKEFIRVFPNLLNRVPQKMIASYLGIAPESLSRVRNEIAKRK